MTLPPVCHPRHRFPAELISHAVWLYHVFSLSLRDVELILAERGVVVSYESIRRWCCKFGQRFANSLRRRRPKPGDRWHLDEVFIRIAGKQHYPWRVVDQHGVVLDILVQSRRNAKAANRFFKKLLRGLQYAPRVIVTDKLRSYGAAKREVLPHVEHRQSRYLNSRAENSHRPIRRRERQMQRFKSGPPRPAVPLRSWTHLRPLPAAAASHGGQQLQGGADRGVPGLARGGVCPPSWLSIAPAPPREKCQPRPVNVTMPGLGQSLAPAQDLRAIQFTAR